MSYEFRNVTGRWLDDDVEFDALVVVGDGGTDFDESFDFDDRVFFYFHDEAEFALARDGVLSGFEFVITGVEV